VSERPANKRLEQTSGRRKARRPLAAQSQRSTDKSRKGRCYNRAVHTTIEAEVDEQGNIRPKEPVALTPGSRVLVTVLEPAAAETVLLSEAALAADWQRPEEDAAWSEYTQE